MTNRTGERIGLKDIKERYFNPGIRAKGSTSFPKAEITHFADCNIYRSLDVYDFVFCSCGLLHDLTARLGSSRLLEVVYPDYQKDMDRQERQLEPENLTPEQLKQISEERSACERVMCEIFGPPTNETLEEIKLHYDEDKSILVEVFKHQYPNAFKRLDDQLAKKLADRRRWESYSTCRS